MLTIDERVMALDDLAEVVAQEFMRLEVVSDFREKKQAFDQDNDVQKKLQTLEDNRAYISYRPEIRALQQDIMLSDSIYQLKLAENDIQTALSDLAEKIAAVISDEIEVDEHLPFKKGGHHGKHHH